MAGDRAQDSRRALRRAFWSGRAGAAYRTGTQLDLREAHAAARDAVRPNSNLETAISARTSSKQWKLFEVSYAGAFAKKSTCCGRTWAAHFSDASRAEIAKRCPRGTDFRSPSATASRSPRSPRRFRRYCPCCAREPKARGWSIGQPFVDPPLPRRDSQRNRRTARSRQSPCC